MIAGKDAVNSLPSCCPRYQNPRQNKRYRAGNHAGDGRGGASIRPAAPGEVYTEGTTPDPGRLHAEQDFRRKDKVKYPQRGSAGSEPPNLVELWWTDRATDQVRYKQDQQA
jgi:hypothetical protein